MGEARFDPLKAGDQFKARMVLEDDPLNLMIGWNIDHQLCVLLQGTGAAVYFPNPESLRVIGAGLIDAAGVWERGGEIPGMKVPEE